MDVVLAAAIHIKTNIYLVDSWSTWENETLWIYSCMSLDFNFICRWGYQCWRANYLKKNIFWPRCSIVSDRGNNTSIFFKSKYLLKLTYYLFSTIITKASWKSINRFSRESNSDFTLVWAWETGSQPKFKLEWTNIIDSKWKGLLEWNLGVNIHWTIRG